MINIPSELLIISITAKFKEWRINVCDIDCCMLTSVYYNVEYEQKLMNMLIEILADEIIEINSVIEEVD